MTTETNLEKRLAEYLVWVAGPEPHVDLAGFVGDELDSEAENAAREHLAGCDVCTASLAVYNEVQGIWEGPPQQRRSFRRSRLLGGGALAAAAAAAILVVMLRPTVDDVGRLQPKGGFDLLVAIDRGGRGAPLRDGERVQTGERLGFFYSADTVGYLAILYGDESGKVVRLYPSGPGPSAALRRGREKRVPDGAVVSAGQGCEWIVGLFSKDPLPLQKAQTLVQRMIEGRDACTLADAREPGVAARVVGVKR